MNESTYFEELRAALELMPDTQRVLDALNRTYRRFLDAHTRQLNISLVGPFAQTDYLLRSTRLPSAYAVPSMTYVSPFTNHSPTSTLTTPYMPLFPSSA